MKEQNLQVAESNEANKLMEPAVILINEETLQERIHMIRGQKVMLDYELAELYGYTTTRFNGQVKNNMEKFDEDFMFQLTQDEFEILMSKKTTSSWGGRRKLPRVFTEQGVYMLMTVLRGDLAIKQSKALIRTFKRMKDYIIENQNLIGDREYLQLSMQISENLFETIAMRKDLAEVEDKMAKVVDELSDVVHHSELESIMNEFGEPHIKRGYLVLNGEPFQASLAYSEIYTSAKKSIYIIDNYIGLKTFELLSGVNAGISIKIFTDNAGKGIRQNLFDDFCKEYPGLHIELFEAGDIFHDRYIILDYDTEHERFYHCGASSKDAGLRVTSIMEDLDTEKYHPLIDNLLQNPTLMLK